MNASSNNATASNASGNTPIVFASSNAGKIAELDALLAPLGWSVKSQVELGVEPLPETAVTFVENAIVKARHVSAETGLPAIADDSGLEVDALQGAPGLYSARYAQMHNAGSGDAANNTLLLNHLQDVPDDKRTARFRCVVVYLRHASDPSPIIAQGVWEGFILHEAAEGGGFGYDPVFCNIDTGTATSLLDKDVKNKLSHRGKAVQELINALSPVAARHTT
jgi:XTP/dITP diphosphohydrolase